MQCLFGDKNWKVAIFLIDLSSRCNEAQKRDTKTHALKQHCRMLIHYNSLSLIGDNVKPILWPILQYSVAQ